MTSEPLPAECAEVQRRLAEGDSGPEMLAHLADCDGCTAFAAALVELEARLAQLPPPDPPAGAADRAISRFRAELAAHGPAGTAPHAQAPDGPPLIPPGPPVAPAGSRPAPTAPPSQSPPARPRRAGHARRRRWRPPVSIAAGVAAAIALVVALVVVLGPASTPPAYAAILHAAAVQTRAEKTARFDLSGAIGLSVGGQTVTSPVTGTGATVFPDRGELTEVATILGRPLRQDIVSTGNRVWMRVNAGPWAQVPVPPDHASPIDQAIANPAQALDDLSRVGSGYHSVGSTEISGTSARQIQLTIPGGSFHAFGDLPQQVGHWTVVVDVSQSKQVLRRLTISGRGVVSVLGSRVRFTYSLGLTLRDFGAQVSVEAPPGTESPVPAIARTPSPSVSPAAVTPSAGAYPSAAAPGSTPTPTGPMQSPSPGPTQTPTQSPCSPAAVAAAARTPTAAVPTCSTTAPPPAAQTTAR